MIIQWKLSSCSCTLRHVNIIPTMDLFFIKTKNLIVTIEYELSVYGNSEIGSKAQCYYENVRIQIAECIQWPGHTTLEVSIKYSHLLLPKSMSYFFSILKYVKRTWASYISVAIKALKPIFMLALLNKKIKYRCRTFCYAYVRNLHGKLG